MTQGAVPYRSEEIPEGIAAQRRLEERTRTHGQARAADRARKDRRHTIIRRIAIVLSVLLGAWAAIGFAAGELVADPHLKSALGISALLALIAVGMSGLAALGLKNNPRSGTFRPYSRWRPP